MLTLASRSARSPLEEAPHRPLTTGVLVVASWTTASLLVLLCHRLFDSTSAAGCAIGCIASILAAAFVYMRIASNRGVAHALGVGIAWLILTILGEIVVTTSTHHGWFQLLGQPAHPLVRNVLMFVWIFAPAVFAKGADS